MAKTSELGKEKAKLDDTEAFKSSHRDRQPGSSIVMYSLFYDMLFEILMNCP